MSIDNPVVNDYVIEMPDLISHLPTADEVKAISSAKVGSVTPEFTSAWDGQTWYLVTGNEKCENVIGKFNSSHFNFILIHFINLSLSFQLIISKNRRNLMILERLVLL